MPEIEALYICRVKNAGILEPSTRQHSRYHILNEYNLIVESLHGPVNLRKLCALRRIQMRDPSFSKGYHSITDLRNAQLDLSGDDLLQFAIQENALRHGNKTNKALMLAETPRQTALAFVLLKKMDRTELDGGVFSTVSGVLEYLNLSSEKAYKQLVTLL